MKTIATPFAPKALGPYSQATVLESGRLGFLSGQIPLTPEGKLVEGGITEQTKQVITNLSEVAKALGATLGNTLKATVFLKNLQDFEAMNAVYESFFKQPYPARSTIEVARLPKDVLVEIEIIIELP